MKKWVKTFGIIFGYLLVQIITVILVMFSKLIFDSSWFYEVEELLNNGQILSTEYMNLILELVYPGLIIADMLMLIPFIFYTKHKKLQIIKPINKQKLLLIFTLGIIVNTSITGVVNLIPADWLISSSYNDLISIISMKDNPIIEIIAVGILAPIIEELVFRFSIIHFFKEKSIRYQIFISAFFFGLAHMNFIQSTYAFVIGLLMAYMYTRKYNLLETILFHITINTSSLIFDLTTGIGIYICYVVIILSFIYYIWYAIKEKKLYVVEEQNIGTKIE